MRPAGGGREGVGGAVQVVQVGVGVVGPDDGRGVRGVQGVTQAALGAPACDRCAVQQQGDDLAAFGVRAAGEFVAFGAHTCGDDGDGVVDEGGDGTQGHVEQFAQFFGVGGE
ncbi:hypothetical protein GCM10010129_40450 [Streptomyces fumigatiscleroticus]|nr:hypothetical protein GCM10010129_40450 [Streptomyces fumigatiscleroticus]